MHPARARLSPLAPELAASAARWVWAVLAASLLDGSARAQATQRVSTGPGGTQADADSFYQTASADGRFVAFTSAASNLVAGDTNGFNDVFVHDSWNGTTERVSVSSGGVQGNADSGHSFPAIVSLSADGRFVAFGSHASDLVAGDTNGFPDIFVHDRQNHTTQRVNVDASGAQANSESFNPELSADGRFVAFDSVASNLVAGDSNNKWDIFVRDLLNGTIERASLSSNGTQGNGHSYTPRLSGDGRLVTFAGDATNLVAGDTNGYWDVFVHDRLTGVTERVSVDSAGVQGDSWSENPCLSADGRFVAFQSLGTNLVANDLNSAPDVFVHDRQTGATERVSVDSNGMEAGNSSFRPSISADGNLVAFWSYAANLVSGDTNAAQDVFVHNRLNGGCERVSVDPGGGQANSDSLWPTISQDGRFVAFFSAASNLVAGDTNGFLDVFVHDRGTSPIAFCFGDGSGASCPCGNSGAANRGCDNSAASGGAQVSASGNASLSGDTLVLTSSGELPTAVSVLLQGSASLAPANFGDGLRCTGGVLKRLYVHGASSGSVAFPQAGDASISVRSAALGDTPAAGATRYYQAYYRDPVLGFCPSPQGNSWNVSSGLAVVWAQ